MNSNTDVDSYDLPLQAFGQAVPPAFFEVLGRIITVHGKIEYLQDRLKHLTSSETSGVKKIDQFRKRCESGRDARNAIIHSRWVFGADMNDPDIFLGMRYKTRKPTSGTVATVSIADVPDSMREHDIVRYTLHSLRKLLRKDIVTMQVGEQAYSEIMLNWAGQEDRISN